MGEEADADWQDGLVEAGIEDTHRWLADKMEAAMMDTMFGGWRQKPRQTVLRALGRGFETVELDDNGNVIEPVRCICGHYAVMHNPRCPLALACT